MKIRILLSTLGAITLPLAVLLSKSLAKDGQVSAPIAVKFQTPETSNDPDEKPAPTTQIGPSGKPQPDSIAVAAGDHAAKSRRLIDEGMRQVAERDFEAAARKFMEAAKLGSADGQFRLGNCYLGGEGVMQNVTEALKLFELAANQGHGPAACNLGVVFHEGNLVARDQSRAIHWFKIAAKRGVPQAMDNLGLCALGEGNPIEARRWFEMGTDAGLPSAMYNLGKLCEESVGETRNPAKAVRLYARASHLGYARAMNNLGAILVEGRLVSRDVVEGCKWYFLAAERGSQMARANLEKMARVLPTETLLEARRRAAAFDAAR